jgi:antitoxin VapB
LHYTIEASMPVNIKNSRVEGLIDEVVGLTGESKTDAIGKALEERRDRLVRYRDADPGTRFWRVMEREIWPSIPEGALGQPLSKAEEEELLGYGPDGV